MASIINASSSGSGGIVQTADASGVLQLQANGTVALQVDSTTAVTIGKTAVDDTTQGFAYRTSGYISVVRSGGAPAYLNRLSSTGAVLEIAYASSTKGTIAADANGVTMTGTAGITFLASQSASSDANTLDDYEEGTWTPTYGAQVSDPTVSYGSYRAGSYIKIGKMVYFQMSISTESVSGGSGSVVIRGWPFPSASGAGVSTRTHFATSNVQSFSSNFPAGITLYASNEAYLTYRSSSSGGYLEMTVGSLSTSSSNQNWMVVSGCYITT